MMFFSAIQFGNLSMLAWLAAALLPWLIHRWVRHRHRTMPWAAAELLLVAMRQRARRVYFQQWLLLAVRTSILALVALAVAEPVWQAWGIDLRKASLGHLVVAIDQSYSMSCRQEDRSRLERAKQHAKRLLDQRYEAYTVIGWAQDAQNVIGRPTAEAALARVAVEDLSQRHSLADLPKAVQAVSAAINRVEQEWPQIDRHQVVFISDMTYATWRPQDDGLKALSALAEQASLAVVDVGDDRRDNLSVVDLSVDSEVILRQQEVLFTALFRGFGSQPWEDVAVEWKVDGQLAETETISFPAGGEVTGTLAQQFIDEGQHTVQVSVTGTSDALPVDDRRWLVIEVRPKLRVACVAGMPNAADDIARALMPYRDTDAFDDTVQANIVPIARLMDLDLSGYDVVALCNVERLTSNEQTRLANYLRLGGGLAILAGEHTAMTGELGNLLPIEIGPVVALGEYQFDPLKYAHPIVEPFRGQSRSGLLQVTIAKYRQLVPKANRKSAQIALAFDTGDPALVLDEVDEGRVAVLAIPTSLASRGARGMPWSSFAVSPSFLPVMQELVKYLASDASQKQQNVLVGQPAVCQWDRSRRSVPIEVRGPEQQQELSALGAEDRGRVIFADTEMSGIYTLSVESDEFARVAVNLKPRESDLTIVDRALLPEELDTSSDRAKQNSRVASDGLLLSRSLLTVVILLLLLESAFACWQGRAWR